MHPALHKNSAHQGLRASPKAAWIQKTWSVSSRTHVGPPFRRYRSHGDLIPPPFCTSTLYLLLHLIFYQSHFSSDLLCLNDFLFIIWVSPLGVSSLRVGICLQITVLQTISAVQQSDLVMCVCVCVCVCVCTFHFSGKKL